MPQTFKEVIMADRKTIEGLANSADFAQLVQRLYGDGKLEYQIDRYRQIYDIHSKKYGEGGIFYSSPGRIEVCGDYRRVDRLLAYSYQLDRPRRKKERRGQSSCLSERRVRLFQRKRFEYRRLLRYDDKRRFQRCGCFFFGML